MRRFVCCVMSLVLVAALIAPARAMLFPPGGLLPPPDIELTPGETTPPTGETTPPPSETTPPPSETTPPPSETTPPPSETMPPPSETTPPEGSHTVLKFLTDSEDFLHPWFYEAGVFWRWAGAGVPTRREGLPAQVLCQLEDGSKLAFPLLWDAQAPEPSLGVQEFHGQVQLSQGYVFSNPPPAPIAVTVLPLGPESPSYPLDHGRFFLRPGAAGLLKLGAPTDGLLDVNRGDLPTALSAVLPGISAFPLPMDWGLDTLDTGVAGTVLLSGHPVLPPNVTLPEDFVPPVYPLTISAGEFIELSFFAGKDRMGCPVFRWVWQVPDPAQMRLFYSTDGQQTWIDDSATGVDDGSCSGYVSRSGLFLYGADSLSFFPAAAQPNTSYSVYLSYQGRESNLLHLTTDETAGYNGYTIGGDRDGGDADGGTLPELEQPAPLPDDDDPAPPAADPTPVPTLPPVTAIPVPTIPPVTPAPLPTPVLELVTETTTQMGGLRLRRLAQAGDTVLFSKQGVAVELSSAFLLGLQLPDDKLLEVTVESPSEDSFRLELLADGVRPTLLPPTTVRLPYPATTAPLECVDHLGVVDPAVYEPESSTVRCTIDGLGTYTIQTTAVPDATSLAPLPIAPAEMPPAAAQRLTAPKATSPQAAQLPPPKPIEAQPTEQPLRLPLVPTEAALPDPAHATPAPAADDAPSTTLGVFVLAAFLTPCLGFALFIRRRHG